MPLINIAPYRAIVPSVPTAFDVSKLIHVPTTTIHSINSFFIDTFYALESNGGFYVANDGVAGFTRAGASPNTSVGGFTRNLNSGRLYATAVSVAGNGSSTAYYSDYNGPPWTSRPIGVTNTWRSAATNSNGVVVMTGSTNSGSTSLKTIRSIDDGITWADITSKAFGGILVRYFDRLGVFLIVDSSVLRISFDDGNTWTTRNYNADGAGGTARDIFDDGTQLVWVTSNNTTTPIRVSQDGINWTPVPYNGPSLGGGVFDAGYGNGMYVMVFNNRNIFTSTDLMNWTSTPCQDNTSLQTVTYGNGQFILTTNGGGYYVYYH